MDHELVLVAWNQAEELRVPRTKLGDFIKARSRDSGATNSSHSKYRHRWNQAGPRRLEGSRENATTNDSIGRETLEQSPRFVRAPTSG
jgi:hypothetical protein